MTCEKLPISIGVLTWGSPKTLSNTLNSYMACGLFDVCDDVMLFAQETTDADRQIAQQSGISRVIESRTNLGIGAGFIKLIEDSRYENILLLENDWVAIESEEVVRSQLEQGLALLDQHGLDVIKYRSRFDPGEPLYSMTYKDREMDSPPHLMECVHWRANPDVDFPEQISKISLVDDWYVSSSKYCCQTNNPTMMKKEFYLKNIAPWDRGGTTLEIAIMNFWKSSDFKIAHSRGLFKHHRMDR